MIKWLTGAPPRARDLVTDDPLATITPRPFQVYAVTRVNPIFIEEDLRKKTGACVCSGAGNSRSSGYESQLSSCVWSGSGEEAGEATLEQPPRSPLKTALSPIPEGRIDYTIPRPVWPRYEDRQRKPPAVRVDGNLRRKMRTPGHRRVHPQSPYDLLKELSDTLRLAEELPAEEVLRDITQKIKDTLASQQSSPSSSEGRSSERLRPKVPPDKLFSVRVLSDSTGSDEDLEAGRLDLLKRLGRFPPSEPLYIHSQGSTSSSSSGFSDLTPTPPSTASLRPFGPVFLHENPISVPNRVRNAMIYETLQCRTAGGYEKLRAEQKKELDRQWTISENEVTRENRVEKDISVFPGLRSPDFTLDGRQAELLIRRLEASKRQRCWCRLLTTAVGLLFFLLSVMVVSMVVTRGKRMFGSL